MNILGINSAYHESSACIICDGRIIAAVEEERFNRRKHGKKNQIDNPDEIPVQAIQYCLKKANILPTDIDMVGFSLNPEKRLQNKELNDLVEPGNWGSVEGEDLFYTHARLVPERLQKIGISCPVTWLDHHDCHMASSYFISPFHEANILVVDGIAELCSTSLGYMKDNSYKKLKEINYPASLGFLWEKFSKYLGFGEYDACKVMGLSAYGNPAHFIGAFRELVGLSLNGGFTMDNRKLRFRVEDYSALEALFGVPRRLPHTEIKPVHEDIAAALQQITDEVLLHLVNYLIETTGCFNLCISGGVGLNCVSNRIILEETSLRQLFVQPASHDAGTALGAALMLWRNHLDNKENECPSHAYLGPSFDDNEIKEVLEASNLAFKRVENIEETAAKLLSEGKIVGYFQGKMEYGPRALGNRSLLADPRNPDIREVLNRKVKHRELFRPFAPSVLYEEAENWFHIKKPTLAADFMLMAYPVVENRKEQIPAVIHVDGTSRIQAVRKEANPRYHKLISAFKEITGVPIVLNTSFNDDEPIVCSPQDAVNTFLKTQIDYLAMGDYLVERNKSGVQAIGNFIRE